MIKGGKLDGSQEIHIIDESVEGDDNQNENMIFITF